MNIHSRGFVKARVRRRMAPKAAAKRKTDRRRVPTEDKRDAILAAALELFIAQHYHGTSIPDIARKAGVADGTIYRYFVNKEELVNELYAMNSRRLVSWLTRPFRPDSSVKEGLADVGLRFLEFFEGHQQEVCFLEKNHHESYLTPESRAIELPLIQLL